MSRHRVRQGNWMERVSWDQVGWTVATVGWVVFAAWFVWEVWLS